MKVVLEFLMTSQILNKKAIDPSFKRKLPKNLDVFYLFQKISGFSEGKSEATAT